MRVNHIHVLSPRLASSLPCARHTHRMTTTTTNAPSPPALTLPLSRRASPYQMLPTPSPISRAISVSRHISRALSMSPAALPLRCSASASSSSVAQSTSAAEAEPSSAGSVSRSPSSSSGASSPSTWRASIDFRWIRENKELVAQNAANRNSTADVEKVVELYEQFAQQTAEVDRLRAERNSVAAAMKGKVEPEKRKELVEQGKQLKEELAGKEELLLLLTEQLQQEGQKVPNLTHSDVPIGGEELAVVRNVVGQKLTFPFPVRDHVELGSKLDLFDFDSAAEVSGAKFYYLKNEAVLLEMALVSWAMNSCIRRGFLPISTPDLVRSNVVEKCGFQPRAANTQVYSVEGMDLCLAGTAEILVGGMYMDRILAEAELPLRVVAVSHCFRTEAGAAGAATRGLYRVHQFTKVEMFVFCRPEDSDQIHLELLQLEEEMFSGLGLHFKTLDMPSHDLGAPAYRKFDIEAWMPGLGRYGEISSASNCTDYQARRLNIRYRPSTAPPAAAVAGGGRGGKAAQAATRFVHTLNATACAVPRMLVSILENFQQDDGSIAVPSPLQPYMGGLDVIRPKAAK